MKFVFILFACLALQAQHLNFPNNTEIEILRTESIEHERVEFEEKLAAANAILAQIKNEIQAPVGRVTELNVSTVNQVSDRFELVETIVRVDGSIVTVPYKNGIIVGEHEISVEQLYRGSASVGQGFENETFRLSGHQIIKIVDGEQVNVRIVTTQKGTSQSGASQLAIRFEVNQPIVVDSKQESKVTVTVNNPAGSVFELKGGYAWVDGVVAETLNPPLVTSRGLIVFEGALKPGQHKLDVVLVYHVENAMVNGMKADEVRMRFSKELDVHEGKDLQISLAGYSKGTAISAPLEEESLGEIQLLDHVAGVGAK